MQPPPQKKHLPPRSPVCLHPTIPTLGTGNGLNRDPDLPKPSILRQGEKIGETAKLQQTHSPCTILAALKYVWRVSQKLPSLAISPTRPPTLYPPLPLLRPWRSHKYRDLLHPP